MVVSVSKHWSSLKVLCHFVWLLLCFFTFIMSDFKRTKLYLIFQAEFKAIKHFFESVTLAKQSKWRYSKSSLSFNIKILTLTFINASLLPMLSEIQPINLLPVRLYSRVIIYKSHWKQPVFMPKLVSSNESFYFIFINISFNLDLYSLTNASNLEIINNGMKSRYIWKSRQGWSHEDIWNRDKDV